MYGFGHHRRRWGGHFSEGHHGGFGGRHGGGRHRGPGGRYFEHGALKIIALALIAEKPRNGYEIIKAVGEKTSGAYEPSPGVVYPTLNLLEESGQIRATEVDGKKVFEITDEGRVALDANRKILETFEERFSGEGASWGPKGGSGEGRPHRSEVRRAMGRLVMAVRTKFAEGVSEQDIPTLVAAIDAAADAVEKA
ncbi:MAG: PadR family transcriptional regulator [Alphaproteobacteria bacterium]|nr:MAG: PadR family transcriptional regulator [Caulobacteraceae bacterium]TPW08099.1 MAG: PadR family transcriptional regulator [Alphaproteobacteria bacterium]